MQEGNFALSFTLSQNFNKYLYRPNQRLYMYGIKSKMIVSIILIIIITMIFGKCYANNSNDLKLFFYEPIAYFDKIKLNLCAFTSQIMSYIIFKCLIKY